MYGTVKWIIYYIKLIPQIVIENEVRNSNVQITYYWIHCVSNHNRNVKCIKIDLWFWANHVISCFQSGTLFSHWWLHKSRQNHFKRSPCLYCCVLSSQKYCEISNKRKYYLKIKIECLWIYGTFLRNFKEWNFLNRWRDLMFMYIV